MSILLDEFGMVVPESKGSGGGGSLNFYKCASVGTGTWTGYLASIDPVTGIWSFAETATSGLTYGSFPVPVVGNVYAGENCICKASDYYSGMPIDGLIFYLPFTEDADYDATGKALSKLNTGNIYYTIYQGIPCVRIGQTVQINGPSFSSIISNDSNARFTMSFWGSCGGASQLLIGFFKDSVEPSNPNVREAASRIELESDSNWAIIKTYPSNYAQGSISDLDKMLHYIVTYDGSSIKLYQSGVQKYVMNTSTPFGSAPDRYPAIGNTYNGFSYVSAFRIYNRVLDSSEIDALAAEFSPTA